MFDFQQFPQLQTARLTLREIVPDDAAAIFRIRGDYAVTRLNIGAAYDSIDQARDLIASMTRGFEEHRELRWGIVSQAAVDDGVIGMCGYNSWNQLDRRASIGFDLARAHWRQGIMREAVTEMLRFGFAEMRLNRVEADASADNLASIRLMQTVGFRHEGSQREQYWDEGAFHDLELFGLLRREWKAG